MIHFRTLILVSSRSNHRLLLRCETKARCIRTDRGRRDEDVNCDATRHGRSEGARVSPLRSAASFSFDSSIDSDRRSQTACNRNNSYQARLAKRITLTCLATEEIASWRGQSDIVAIFLITANERTTLTHRVASAINSRYIIFERWFMADTSQIVIL